MVGRGKYTKAITRRMSVGQSSMSGRRGSSWVEFGSCHHRERADAGDVLLGSNGAKELTVKVVIGSESHTYPAYL